MTAPGPSLSGRRFAVSYALTAADDAAAREMAREICIEQTVEFPSDLLPPGPISDEVVGRVEEMEPQGGGRFLVRISYAAETAGGELPQLLNVMFGNTSLKAGVRVEALHLEGSGLLQGMDGPRFGVPGLRRLAGAQGRPLLCTALKPMGLSPRQLADMARDYALGGVDMIKDDHGLADQPFCPFKERVERCAAAVAEANRRSGGATLYVPNLSAPAHLIQERADLARRAGAGGLMIAPGLVGWDAMRALAGAAGPGLPLLCHPALLGSFLVSPNSGVAPRVLLGQLPRLCGADAVIFPHHGGRFPVTAGECRELAAGAAEPMGDLRPTLPTPAGGVHLERVPELRAFYGEDIMLLIGGDLHRGADLVESCQRFRALVEAALPRRT